MVGAEAGEPLDDANGPCVLVAINVTRERRDFVTGLKLRRFHLSRPILRPEAVC